jgi:hypothetical protein
VSDETLCPPGNVELQCEQCGWYSWHDPLSDTVMNATDTPFICDNCKENPLVGFTCTACNRPSTKSHHEMVAERDHHAHHCCECLKANVPYHSFAEIIWCWSCSDLAPTPLDRCSNVATHVIVRPRDCSCSACWQTEYHACDAHVEDLVKFFQAIEVRKLPTVLS